MWCFVDESWQQTQKEHIGVLAAAIGPRTDFEELGRLLYRLRKKYFGEQNVRDLRSELKGKDLFTNLAYKQHQKGYSKNLSVAREVLEWAGRSNIRLVGVCVFGNEKPPLLSPDTKLLSPPFRELCIRVMAHIPAGGSAQLIFDQRLGAQEEISIAVHNYLAGIRGNTRLMPQPLIGVSNVWPGLQLTDIVAFVLGKYAAGDDRLTFYYRLITRIQVKGTDHRQQGVFGLIRLQWEPPDKYKIQRSRAKK